MQNRYMFCSDWKRTKNHLCRTIASGVCKRSKHSCCFIAKKRNSRRSVRGVIGILSLRYKKIKGSFVQYMSWAWVVAFVPKIHVIKILGVYSAKRHKPCSTIFLGCDFPLFNYQFTQKTEIAIMRGESEGKSESVEIFSKPAFCAEIPDKSLYIRWPPKKPCTLWFQNCIFVLFF